MSLANSSAQRAGAVPGADTPAAAVNEHLDSSACSGRRGDRGHRLRNAKPELAAQLDSLVGERHLRGKQAVDDQLEYSPAPRSPRAVSGHRRLQNRARPVNRCHFTADHHVSSPAKAHARSARDLRVDHGGLPGPSRHPDPGAGLWVDCTVHGQNGSRAQMPRDGLGRLADLRVGVDILAAHRYSAATNVRPVVSIFSAVSTRGE